MEPWSLMILSWLLLTVLRSKCLDISLNVYSLFNNYVFSAYTFEVWAGAHNVRASSEPERIEITSHDGWTHPQWDSNDLSNDLALIRLPEKITFTGLYGILNFLFSNIIYLDNIRPSCLPKAGQTADPGMVVTPIGWGRPSDCKQWSSMLSCLL